MKVYTGSAWVDAYSSGTTFLTKANNLSDLTSASTARTNLGLGTAATTASTDYATAAQGTKADSALQPATIGVSVQAYDADLVTIAGLTPTNNYAIIGNGTSWTSSALPASGVTSVTGTSPVVSSGGSTPVISMPAATTSVNGYLTSTDWNTFNGKGNGTVTSVGITAGTAISVSGSPITGSGSITINNTGVTSIVAGTGISISGGTGAVTITNTSSVNSSQLAKAWVNWAGSSGTINSSYNVSSVTRNSTGDYTVNFTNAFANTNYAVVYGGNRNNGATDAFSMNFYSQATGSVRVNTSLPAINFTDATAACIACFA